MPSTRRATLALYILALCVLVQEVTLTRVFSVMSWHHFAYLIISLALLGFGAASSYLTVSPRFRHEGIDPDVPARYALGFSIAIVLGFATATKIHFYPIDIHLHGDYSNLYSLALLYVIVGVPFFFAGVCIAYLISRAGSGIPRFYFADLLGAGTGALVALAGINWIGAEATIYATAALAAVAALVLHPSARSRLGIASLVTLAGALIMTVVATRHEVFPVYFPPDKIFRLGLEPHYHAWHVVARVDVLDPQQGTPGFGGVLSPAFVRDAGDPAREVRGIYQDGGAGTGILRVPGGRVLEMKELGYYLQAAPYVVRSAPARALVIGVGGGIDVLIALYHGARRVVGVEVNPVVVDAIRNRYADFAGHVFERPDVEIITAEGRHYLTTTPERYDVIQLSGVDTFTALASGAYALAENYLYTSESIEDYWRHLTDDGVLSFSRWLFTPPRETLRLVTTETQALRRLGIANPERHFVVISSGGEESANASPWAETLLKRTPFSEQEVQSYREWAVARQFKIIYDPYVPQDNMFNRMIRASDEERAKLVRDYPYNIRPVTDDDPFFFDFYRWRALWSTGARYGAGGYYLTKFPLSLAMLLVGLVQIVILAALFILGPLWVRGNPVRQAGNRRSIAAYFAALGLGFITIEIALLQKYTVFVGGPVYAMSVTLFAILVFSGFGSLLVQRLAQPSMVHLQRIVVGLVALLLLEIAFANAVVPHLMFLAHPVRCVVAVAALAPLAMLMGMPFPTGLRIVQRRNESVVPWAWGVNAMATTLGAVVCVLASLQWGFTVSLLGAAALYATGLLAIRRTTWEDARQFAKPRSEPADSPV